MTREEAIALAIKWAHQRPHAYVTATDFTGHEWVIEAIMEAAHPRGRETINYSVEVLQVGRLGGGSEYPRLDGAVLSGIDIDHPTIIHMGAKDVEKLATRTCSR